MTLKKYLNKMFNKLLIKIKPIYRKFIYNPSKSNNLMPQKIDMIDYLFKTDNSVTSFADLGGVWGIDGGYTFYILEKYNIEKAILIDNIISNLTVSKSSKYPQLQLYSLDFSSDEAVSKVSNVDAIILFDILLHQVNPDWDEILTKYAPITKYFIIINPQFNAEKTTRLLDLGKEEYFKQIPKHLTYEYNLLFTDRESEIRDSPNVWQWGIIDNDIKILMKKLNFEEIYYRSCYKWGTSKFISKAFIFRKIE